MNFQYDFEKLIVTYLKHYYVTQEDGSTVETFWAHEKVDDIIANNPEEGLRVALELIRKSEDDATLEYVAAGPLENLMVYHGKKIIDKIKIAADLDRKIQIALAGVWLDKEEDEIYSEWEKLMKRYNFF